MIPAFWDSSGLVPLCVRQQNTDDAHELLQRYSVVVWWATAVEMQSAFERLRRMGQLADSEYARTGVRVDRLRQRWREVKPSDSVRGEAARLLGRYPLKAADALQLAAAWTWSCGVPRECVFISGDGQLLDAARNLGFQVVAV